MKSRALLSWLAALVVFVLGFLPMRATAEGAWPVRSVTMICPYPAGGGTDSLLRAYAKALSQQTGQKVDVLNISGGGGGDGLSAMMRAPADGYTIGMITFVLSSLAHQGLLPFTWRDFDPLMRLNADYPLLAVRTNSPFKTLQDFADYAKKAHRTASIGNTGPGSAYHMVAAQMSEKLGIVPRHVPFDGGSSALQALIGGQIDAACLSVPEIRGKIGTANVRVLGVAGEARSPYLPDVPTFAELIGLSGAFPIWRGIALPKGVPADTRSRIIAVLKAAFDSREFKETARDLGFTLAYLDAAQFAAFLDENAQQVGLQLRRLGVVRR